MATSEKREPGRRESATSRVEKQIRGAVTELGEHAQHASESVREGMQKFSNKFNGVKGTVVDKTKECARATDTYVNENPWLAVGIGAGIGFVLGMLLSPRGSNNRPYV